MSKLQLLYEKLMRIAYIFGAIFFVIALIDFSVAMMIGAFDCTNSVICQVDEGFPFFKVTLLPLTIGTFVFIITGFIFFKLAHQETELLSVSDYKKSLEEEADPDELISREELYEKLRRGNRKQKPKPQESFFVRLSNSTKEFFSSRKEKMQAAKEQRKLKAAEREELKVQTKIIEEKQKEHEIEIKAKTKLNKTGLILYVSHHSELTQNDSRKFVNALLDVIKETVIAEEEVKLAKFGRFEKVHIKESVEVDPETSKETKIDAHNTVEFFAYKQLLNKISGVEVIEDEVETPKPVKEEPKVVEEVVPEPVKEEPKVVEEVVPEPVKEEPKVIEEVVPEPVKGEPKAVEEDILQPVKEEPKVVEEVVPEPVKEEPKVVEEVVPEPVKEEPKVVEEVVPEPVKEEPKVVEEVVPEPVKEVKPVVVAKVTPEPKVEEKTEVAEPAPVKVKKVGPVTKTKKQFIEMMDETTDLSKNKANKFLKFFAEVVKEQLALRNEVELEGIGFFTTIEMPAKEAVNPQTGQKIIVPAHHQVRLRFDDDLKDKMNT